MTPPYKRYVLSFSILGAVAIALALVLLFQGGNGSRGNLPELALMGQIAKISIERDGEEPVVLTLRGGVWIVEPEGYRADQNLVSGIAAQFARLRLSALVSVSGDTSRYELDEKARISVAVADVDGKKRVVFVGKKAIALDHTYVSLEDDDRVFQAVGGFRSSVALGKEQYRDTRVFAFDPAVVSSVSIAFDGGAAALLPKKPDNSAYDELLETLSVLTCSAYRDDADVAALARREDFYLKIELAGDHPLWLTIFAADDAGQQAISSESESPFDVASWKASRIRELAESLTGSPAE